MPITLTLHEWNHGGFRGVSVRASAFYPSLIPQRVIQLVSGHILGANRASRRSFPMQSKSHHIQSYRIKSNKTTSSGHVRRAPSCAYVSHNSASRSQRRAQARARVYAEHRRRTHNSRVRRNCSARVGQRDHHSQRGRHHGRAGLAGWLATPIARRLDVKQMKTIIKNIDATAFDEKRPTPATTRIRAADRG